MSEIIQDKQELDVKKLAIAGGAFTVVALGASVVMATIENGNTSTSEKLPKGYEYVSDNHEACELSPMKFDSNGGVVSKNEPVMASASSAKLDDIDVSAKWWTREHGTGEYENVQNDVMREDAQYNKWVYLGMRGWVLTHDIEGYIAPKECEIQKVDAR